MVVLTQCRLFQLPQAVVTLSEVSKSCLLVNKNRITLLFLHNTDIEIENQ